MRLYLRFLAMHLKSRMAYRKSFFFSIIGRALTTLSGVVSISFLFMRFHEVRGYTLGEVLLCAGIVTMSFGLSEMLFRGFDKLADEIRTGRFDRLMLRPKSLMFQVLCVTVEFSRIGKLLQAILMLGYGMTASHVLWTVPRVLVLLMMIAVGFCVFSSLYVLQAGLSFFTLEGLETVNIFTYGAEQFGAYPLDIYGRRILKICTFGIPYALFLYYPYQWLIGRTTDAGVLLLCPLALWFAVPCWIVWRMGVRKYRSSGS